MTGRGPWVASGATCSDGRWCGTKTRRRRSAAPDSTGPFITWGPPLAPKVGTNRLHLEVAPAAGVDTQAEVDRLLSLGATVIDAGVDGVDMVDPDDNELRVRSADDRRR